MIRRRKILWLLALAVAVLVGVGLKSSLVKGTSEVPVYTTAAARMLDGEAIYRPDEDKPFTYPPFFAVPFMPLARLGSDVARALWFLANVAMLGFVLLVLARNVRPTMRSARRHGRGPPLWLFWVVVLVLAARHIAAVFANQSHDFVVLVALTLIAVASGRSRDAQAGAWAGFGAACKATPLLFVPVFVLQKRFLAALIGTGVTVLLLLLPDWITPQRSGSSWLWSWYETFLSQIEPGQTAEASGAWGRWNILNQNLTGTLWRLSRPPEITSPAHFDVRIWNPSDTTLRAVSYIAQAVVLGLIAFATRASLTTDVAAREVKIRRLGEVGLVACGMVLLSPMSSKSHFCVLLLPITFCTLDLLYRRFDTVLAVLLAIAFLAGTFATKGVWGKNIGNEILARGSVTWCALALLLASAHALFYRRFHDRHTPSPTMISSGLNVT